MQTIVNFALEHGVHSLHLGEVAARDVRVTGKNYRENFLAQGFSPRVRAMLDCLEQGIRDNTIKSPHIFAPEAITPFARHMSERFEHYYGSEYMPEPARSETATRTCHIKIWAGYPSPMRPSISFFAMKSSNTFPM